MKQFSSFAIDDKCTIIDYQGRFLINPLVTGEAETRERAVAYVKIIPSLIKLLIVLIL